MPNCFTVVKADSTIGFVRSLFFLPEKFMLVYTVEMCCWIKRIQWMRFSPTHVIHMYT